MERFSVRLHGLGGQGIKSMIQDILAPIILEAGFHIQAFPFFGGERRGALVTGYIRCGENKITTHSFITNPDMVVIFDHERISVAKATEDLRTGGIVLINTLFPNQFMEFTHNWQVYAVNARKISLAHGIGRKEDPYLVINTAMAGAIINIFQTVFRIQFTGEVIKTVLSNALPQKALENYAALLDGEKNVIRISDASPMRQWPVKTRATPYITQPDERCTKCNFCYLFCPKRAIEITAKNIYFIREEKCNYCGICVTVCPRNAIAIVTQEGGARHG